MAECIFKYLINKNNLNDKFYVDSSATSREEIGNQIYPPARAILNKYNIPVVPHRAKQFTKSDYDEFDYVICMERYNVKNLSWIIGADCKNKVKLIMSFAGLDDDVEDPWYSGNFEKVYQQLMLGCNSIIQNLL